VVVLEEESSDSFGCKYFLPYFWVIYIPLLFADMALEKNAALVVVLGDVTLIGEKRG
jgi:hypothetical protein